MAHNKIRCFLIAFLFSIVIILPSLLYFMDKPDIQSATYNDIYNLEEFGDILTYDIIQFIKTNPNADIEDLILIDGIGEKRMEILRKNYK